MPRGKAQGFMRFTNRTGGAVAVPLGTQFKAPNGVAVQTTQAGTVPGTNFSAQPLYYNYGAITAGIDGGSSSTWVNALQISVVKAGK